MKKYPKINFIGNKEKILHWIVQHIPMQVTTIFDAFSGGSSVSYCLKQLGYHVFSNDILLVNYLLAKALIENKKTILSDSDINFIFHGNPLEGYMFNNYSNILYFPNECMELDLYRTNILNINNEYKQALAFSLIRRAMIRKMPYSRFNLTWDKITLLRNEEYSYMKYKRRRAYHNLSFYQHFMNEVQSYNNAIFDNGYNNIVYNNDILDIIHNINADLIYLDPPYTGTMNDYFSFYGLLDEWILGQKQYKFTNNFTDKNQTINLLTTIFKSLNNFKYCLLSYNNNSYPDLTTLLDLIKPFSKKIEVFEQQHDYKLTSKLQKKKNIEYLLLIYL